MNHLISAQALCQSLADVVLIDVRHNLSDHQAGRRAYEKGHIQGAHFLDHETELAAPKTGLNGRHPLPVAEDLAKLLAQKGLSQKDRFVVYDDQHSFFAAHMWWLLRWLGCEHVQVLDGGLKAWLKAGGELVQTLPECTVASAWQVPQETMPTKQAQEVLTNLTTAEYVVVDARGATRYRGEVEPIDPVAGHIPGALNRPCTDNVDEEGYFKSPECLQKEWQAILGDRPASEVIHQCGSGITACHNLLAMELAGLSGSMLYPGSWSQWCALPDYPIATGA